MGVSVDGTRAIHDGCRRDAQGAETFERIVANTALLDRFGVDYNILSVVTKDLAKRPEQIFQEFFDRGWRYQQYIACMQPLEWTPADGAPFLTAEQYAAFLKRLFDVWYKALGTPRQCSVRFFDNLVDMLTGRPPELCAMGGVCSVQYMVEANGNVYPCDFFGTDPWLLGNLHTDAVADLDRRRLELGFVERSRPLPQACRTCRWNPICHCDAFKQFFPYAIERLERVAAAL